MQFQHENSAKKICWRRVGNTETGYGRASDRVLYVMVQFFLCDHIYIGLGLHLANHAQWVEKMQTMSIQNFIVGATGYFFSIFKKFIPTKNFGHGLFSVFFEFMTNHANKSKNTFIGKKGF